MEKQIEHSVNVVRRKLIKPCSPTPQTLKKHKISFIDELVPPMNMGIILFFPISISIPNPKPNNLEESLAKILPQFYPLAGRYIKEELLVDCSDEGAEFVEAEAVELELADLVTKMEPEKLHDLLPSQFYQLDESPINPLLSIQVTKFKCGGLAIGITIAHRIFDAFSLGTVLAAWSYIATNPEGKITICPSYDSPSLFPSTNQGHPPDSGPSGLTGNTGIVCKTFSFNKESITKLKSKLRPNTTFSRVRVVCAVVAKALIGVDQVKHGKSRPCVVLQAINLRGRTVPPLPKHSCGNLLTMSLTRCMNVTETSNIGIQELVDILGDGIQETISNCAEILSPGVDRRSVIMDPFMKSLETLNNDEVNTLLFSDWSKFGFYEADLGWGKPVGVGMVEGPRGNMIVLMHDKEGDGIVAWVNLNCDHMPLFEQDEDIKLFTT